jgi:hypothetical protein
MGLSQEMEGDRREESKQERQREKLNRYQRRWLSAPRFSCAIAS